MCGEYDFVHTGLKKIWKNRTKIISVSEQNGSRIMHIRKSERSDVGEAVRKSFKQQRSDIVPVSGILVVIFVLPKF
jgi:hypothetical protein